MIITFLQMHWVKICLLNLKINTIYSPGHEKCRLNSHEKSGNITEQTFIAIIRWNNF